MTSTDGSGTSTEPDHPWQFSIRTMLLVTFATALALGVVVSTPNVVASPVMICLTIAIPAMLVIVIINGSRYQRAFCIGALFPTGIVLYVTGWTFGLLGFEGRALSNEATWIAWLEFFDDFAPLYRAYVGSGWLLAIIVGSITVVVQWRFDVAARRKQER